MRRAARARTYPIHSRHFACFTCRKAFQRHPPAELPWHQPLPPEVAEGFRCPECGAQLHDMGRYFKAPRREDVKAWQEAEAHIRGGRRFG